MENLELKYTETRAIEGPISATEKLQEIYIDDNVCCYFTGPRQLHIRDISGTTLFDIPIEFNGKIVHISYLNIWKVVFIATEMHLIALDIVSSKFSSYKYSDAEIVQASWNPTQTFLVVVNNLGKLSGYCFKLNNDATYGHTFVPLSHGCLEEEVPNSVYVGWGAHNTQFKGSKKQVAVIKEIPQEYSYPVISWRGNGEMFVINYWKDNRRFLKVFDANLRSLFTTEPYNNLLAATSFKEKGSFIACAATDGESNRIVIFEKNCLVKSSFLIPENKGEIKDIQYHKEKHILAVCSHSSFESCLNIYLYANDTWYLKQQLCYPTNEQEKILKFHWVNDSNISTCRLNVLTSRAITMYEFTIGAYGVYHGIVAVIDGLKVSLTKFSQEIVPPPMASKTLHFEKPVNKISLYASENVYGFYLSDGGLEYYKYENGDFVNFGDGTSLEKIPTSINSMSSFDVTLNGPYPYRIELNEEQDLIINEKIVFSNVLSVYVHGHYLLFTHVGRDSYQLSSVRLTQQNISAWNPEMFFSREVEQGAKIVCVTNKDQVILVMPRGNLETITCRLIAIDAIERLLSQNLWHTAISQIRSQKLNWNLLIDLNRQRFVSHVRDFIEAAGTVSLLNTIVTEFGTENCLQTMYKAWSRQDSPMEQYLLEKDASETPKIDILGTILKILVELNPILNLLSIVTLQIKHYSIRVAVNSVLHTFELNQLETCKKAIDQILRYKHAKDVISAAYTLYNIDFLSFVYLSCSEDPKVFGPEIKELRTLSHTDLRYVMNVRGKEFEKATKYLVRSDSKDDEFISKFITKYATQSVAYNNVRPGDPYFKLVTIIYADHLALKTRHNEAGLILERAGLREEALNRYKIARNWQKVVTLLNVLNVQEDSKKQTLRTLAQDLINHKQVEQGANIYEHYCGDYTAAIEAFTEHKMFQKALCLSRQYNAKELIGNLIEPTLKKYREDLYDRISELGSKYSNYTTRLLRVREKKIEKLLRRQMIDDGVELEHDGTEFEGDSVNSEYGSIISRSSMGSFSSGGSKSSSMSSRNRRKMERKKTDLREGGGFEDIALIRQLYLLAIDIFAVGQEVTEICLCLTDEDNFRYGKLLQGSLEDVQRRVRADIPRIWSDTFLNAETSSKPTIVAVIENRHELDEQFRTPPPPEKLQDDWKLLMFT